MNFHANVRGQRIDNVDDVLNNWLSNNPIPYEKELDLTDFNNNESLEIVSDRTKLRFDIALDCSISFYSAKFDDWTTILIAADYVQSRDLIEQLKNISFPQENQKQL